VPQLSRSGIKPPTPVPPRVPPSVPVGGLDGSLRVPVPSRPAPESKKPYRYARHLDSFGLIRRRKPGNSRPSHCTTWKHNQNSGVCLRIRGRMSGLSGRSVPTGPSRVAAMRAYKFQISERKFSFPASTAPTKVRSSERIASFPASIRRISELAVARVQLKAESKTAELSAGVASCASSVGGACAAGTCSSVDGPWLVAQSDHHLEKVARA
jgi:hypothetical protein